MKKEFLIFFFLITEFIFCENIKFLEEKITGEKKTPEKTEIFVIPLPQIEIKFPEIKILKIIEKKEKRKKAKEEKRENYFVFLGGSFNTFNTEIFRKMQLGNTSLTFNSENFFTSGYRENDRERENKISLELKRKKHSFSFDFARGTYALPGPYFLPFDTERKWISIKTKYGFSQKEGFFTEFNNSFYKIDDLKSFYSSILFGYKINPVSFITEFKQQNFKGTFSMNSFSEKIMWEKEKLKFGGEIKKIEDYGERFLPYFKFYPHPDLSFKLEGIYRISDLWEDVQISDYKEIDKKIIPPEEKYNFEISFNKTQGKNKLKTSFSTSYLKIYTWKDTDGDFLLQPYREKFWQSSLNLYFSHKFAGNTEIFFYGNKDLRSEDVNYYPEEKINTGIKFDFSPYQFKIWTDYTGKRKFDTEKVGSFLILNSQIVYKKKNMEITGTIYNLTGKKYFIIPGYPAENRKFIISLKIYF